MEKYKIEEITARDEMEQLGTKEKFWFYDENNNKKLFKIGRPTTGEDWSEKVAYELAKLLNIPCAKYEFAIWNGNQGTVSTSFIPEGTRLVHGNELLVEFYDDEYPKSIRYKLKDYKLSIVLNLLENELAEEWVQIPKITENFKIIKAIDVFIGYLIFDCWIANQDRHHENWGIMRLNDDDICFAYTYDHAAGLGSKVSDEEAEKRLQTNDVNYKISKFVTRAKTPFYNDSDKKMTTISVVEVLLERYPEQTLYWIDKIENTSKLAIQNILDKVPNSFMSNVSKEFAGELLNENKKRLIKLKEGGNI